VSTEGRGTSSSDRVDIFALLCLSLHISSMSFVGVGGEAEETLCPSPGKCDGSRRAVRERAMSLWTLESGLRPVAIVHLGEIRS
jgi:hypothetical protein